MHRAARARRLVLVPVALAAALLAAPLPAAEAHAYLASSSPADGEVLAAAPSVLRLDFSEPVVLGSTRVDIANDAGQHLAPTALSVEAEAGQGASQGANGGADVNSSVGATGDSSIGASANPGTGEAKAPVELLIALPALERGTYRVSWETLSADDLHRTTGVIVFGVAREVTAAGLREPPPPPLESGLRLLLLVGLALALGGALAARLLDGSVAALARTHSACGAIGAAGVAVILLAVQLTTSGANAAELLWSPYGLRWAVREVGLLTIVAATTASPASRVGASRSWLLGFGAVVACVGTALLGHSGAGTTLDVTRVLASAAHLGAAMTWAGGVVVLALALFAGGRRRGADGPANDPRAREALRRFGPPAAACVAVMIVTGVYLSSEVVGSVDAALRTIYGRTLLLKLGLVGAAGALALVNTLRLHRGGRPPASDRAAPRRPVVAEAAVVVGILALAAVLTSAQPAMEPQLVASASSGTRGFVDGRADDLQEAVSISPNRPGPNVISVDVFNTRRPAPGPVRAVRVVVTSADGITLPELRATPSADGRWTVNATLGAPGPLALEVVVERGGLPETTAGYAWTVGGLPDQTLPAVVSTAPIAPWLRSAALALLVVFVAFGLALAVRRQGQLTRRGRPRAGPTAPADPATALDQSAATRTTREPAVH